MDHDAIIIGGGHNGLVAACYLSRAGLDVLVLERRDILGGACVTEELFPGYRFSACSYICHLLQDKVIDDLELRRHGFKVYHLDPSRYTPFSDGSGLPVWDDVERTQEEIARFSTYDAQRYPEWIDFWDRASRILHRYFLTSPPTIAEIAESVRGTPEEEFFERLLFLSVTDVVTEFFESNELQGSFISAQDVGDPNAPGSAWCYAYIKCNALNRDENVGIVRGGMGGITSAMAKSARESGATLRTDAEVGGIVVSGGEAVGVRMGDGTEIRSRIVISNADPKRTYLSLIRSEDLGSEFRDRVRRLKTNAAYLKFHASLDRLPSFYGKETDHRWLAEIKICPSIEYYEQSWRDASQGNPSRNPVMEVQIPSVYDDSMAPTGHHVMSVWSLYAPVKLREGSWEERREEVGEAMIDSLSDYAPDLRDAIQDWSLFTPFDMENRVGLTDGNIRHLDIVPSQFLAQRPMLGWANYRTPVENLYLCGAGTHPGGEVTGAPGHNSAMQILKDI